ncbi:Major facilitator superfamily MFS_1 [Hyella patelloides LEGE 07179]|uniref:Major facilitator superfamily MFS_1 n=2 Tax=Hyella TaxID=945733 RepID=A0A563VWG0_9CYAN|nr:Major facilitator superfamily MFS_1 [Hyella patelloides LEGE 07179]
MTVCLGQLVSILGSGLSNFALDVWVYQQHGSVTELSFLILASSFPMVVISPFAGILIDRWNRRWVMIFSDCGAAITTVALIILLVSENIQIWHIYLASIAISIVSGFQIPAFAAATTTLVPQKHLARANSMTQLSQAVGQLVSPILAGFLLEFIHLSGIFTLDLVSFVFALAILLFVRFPNHKTTASKETFKVSVLSRTLDGWRYLKAHYGLMALSLFFAGSNFLVGIVQVSIYPLVLSFASEVQLGTILSFGGIGMIIGSILVGTWGNSRKKYINLFFYFMFLQGFAIAVAGIYPSVLLFSTASFLFFLGLPFVNSCMQIILQKKVSPDIQGRVFSFNNAIAYSSLPLAYLIAGPLADKIFEPLMLQDGLLASTIGKFIGTGNGRGIGLMFILLGGLNILITAISYQYKPLRNIEDK